MVVPIAIGMFDGFGTTTIKQSNNQAIFYSTLFSMTSQD